MSLTAQKQSANAVSSTGAEMSAIAAILRRQTGIVLPTDRIALAYARLWRRLQELNLSSLGEYVAVLEDPNNVDEIDVMIDLFTTNTTAFFREPHHFDILGSEVLHPIIQAAQRGRRDRVVRIWSAGCSRGHEPYSIAGILMHRLPNLFGWDAKVLATDIDATVLNIAREGIYSLEEAKSVPESYRKLIFRGVRDQSVSVSDASRSLVAFKRLNLIDYWPITIQFDAIFCRNVLIYFDRDTQAKILNKMCKHLKPEGRIFLGHSESIKGLGVGLKVVGPTSFALA